MVAVRLEEVGKTFGSVTAVNRVSLDIPEGELFFLLGPSGCGKTTILRMIAGFESPDSGRILFDDKPVTDVPAHKRNTGMVFQNYALWPHMTVFDNVAYGLRVRKIGRAEISKRTSQALEMVRMSEERSRYPNQLSGGQQQRIALARALVIRPGCLLLDEPLSNLDAKLRLEMRAEIRRIHSETRVTTIYVTHDQKEALSMAERLAVLSAGNVAQVGIPDEIYRHPRSAFVAAFIGETNLIVGKVSEVEGHLAKVATEVGELTARLWEFPGAKPGASCVISVRPEDINVSREAAAGNAIEGRLSQYTFLGEVGQYVVAAGRKEFRVLVMAPEKPRGEGEKLYLTFPPDRALALPDGPVGG